MNKFFFYNYIKLIENYLCCYFKAMLKCVKIILEKTVVSFVYLKYFLSLFIYMYIIYTYKYGHPKLIKIKSNYFKL